MTPPIVLTVCGDPGGARALAPVLRLLQDEGRVQLHAFAYAQGLAILRHHGIDAQAIPDSAADTLITEALRHAAVLVSATSVNDREWEKAFIREARKHGVPSLAVLDFWSNYRTRFADDDGALTAVPDVIAVMDGNAADALKAVGIYDAEVIVTGQPAFDELADARARMTDARREALRRSIGVAPDDLLVLFASQPFRALRGAIGDPGYDEETVLDLLVPALEQAARAGNRRVALLIRPHPRETPGAHDHRRSDRIAVMVRADGDGREWVLAADVVTGMSTALLVEACHLGALVLSLQPGLTGPDALPTNTTGQSTPVYSASDVQAAVDRLLREAAKRGANSSRAHDTAVQPSATRRVVDCVYSLLASR